MSSSSSRRGSAIRCANGATSKDGTSLWWHVQSRGKRSAAVDLRTPDGQAIARALATRADIVVENFRPGTLEGWNLAYESLAARQSGTRHGAHLGLRPNRAVPRAARASA